MTSVLHATPWYPPKYMGGTEVYVTGLVRELRALGISNRVVTACDLGEPDGYEFEGVPVRTYPSSRVPWRAELRGCPAQPGFRQFCQLVQEEPGAIYHQHSWDIALGARHLRAAREAGLKTVLTTHTAWNVCLRGTMIKFGREACDGRIDPTVCAVCWMEKHGVPPTFGRPLAAIPPGVSRYLGSRMPEKHLGGAFFARALGERRKQEFAEMVHDADCIVAISSWLLEALKLNGVPAEKLVLCRNGVDPGFAAAAANARKQYERGAEEPFRLVYLGRWDPRKGIHVLVRAIRAMPSETRIELTIHGVGEGPEPTNYAEEVRRLAADDRRIRFQPPVPRSELPEVFSRADAMVLPSLALEACPMVVLEAKAAGIRIIGSRLGGIPELVREPEDGVLVPAGDVNAWTQAIERMATNSAPGRHATLRGGVRTMREVAADMAALYRSLS